jgi:hypothetical protein
MKNLSILLAVLSMGATPLIGEEPSSIDQSIQVTQPEKQLGSFAIAEIRKGYEKGDYDPFLKELDDSYQAVREKNQLTQLIEMRQGLSSDWEKWDDQARRLQEQKGKELIVAVEDEQSSLFRDKVLSVAHSRDNPEQEAALYHIATLRQMAPGTGVNSDENRLIDLDLEYEYKSLQISMPGKSGLDLKEKQMVLRLDKAKKMVDLSMTFQDASLKDEVSLYVQDLDQRLAQTWDMIDLNTFVQGKEKPSNRTEEKVSFILKQYQEKFSDLARQFIAEHEGK